MIRRLTRAELPACLEVFHRGYETVAAEFGLTEENSPDRGRASLPLHKLMADFEGGTELYGCFIEGELAGCLGLRPKGEVCKLEDIIVLPGFRGRGIGTELLSFAKSRAADCGAERLTLGMIDDNRRLRRWYEANGFVTTSYVNYPGAPYTVGRMEFILKEEH